MGPGAYFMIRAVTTYLVLAVIVILGVWDVIAYLKGTNSTISVVVTDWSRAIPSVAFLCGLLCGHWFFPAKGSED